MEIEAQQIIVLLAFAATLAFINLKAGTNLLHFLTFWPMLACFAGAAWIVVRWLFL